MNSIQSQSKPAFEKIWRIVEVQIFIFENNIAQQEPYSLEPSEATIDIEIEAIDFCEFHTNHWVSLHLDQEMGSKDLKFLEMQMNSCELKTEGVQQNWQVVNL